MEVTNDGENKPVEDVVMQSTSDEPTVLGSGTQQPANKKPTRMSQNQDARHSRGVSVDMLADDRCDATSQTAYLTPQSGISITSSAMTTSSSIVSSASNADKPSIDDQIAQVSILTQQPITNGQKGYIVSKKWLTKVQDQGTKAKKSGKQVKGEAGEVIGALDNSGLHMMTDPSTTGFTDEAGEPFIPLKMGLLMGEDFEVIPEEAWELIIRWYGVAEGSPVIIRYCHNTSTSLTMENLQFELYPPVFTILKLPDRRAGLTFDAIKEKDLPPVKILASRHELYQQFLKRAKTAAGIDIKTNVRTWRILGGLQGDPGAEIPTPDQSRSVSPAPNLVSPIEPGNNLVLDVNVFVALQEGSQREMLDAKDETMNAKYNGHSNLDLVGLGQEGVIVLEEQIGGPAGGEWVSVAQGSNSTRLGVTVSVTKYGSTAISNGLKPRANISSGRSSPAIGGMMTRGRASRNGKIRGAVGLGNLGNTCYMNAALQCVRSIEELTQYFLQSEWTRELNLNNPLGHHGEVAKAYSSLLREIYSDGSSSSFSPRNFKQVIGRYGPSFSGYGQQDSQEFLLFLLDGLQEDLNRIQQKPYVVKPDSTDEMVHNSVALQGMADECWDIYKARNDSVITDLFAGMYKSTVVCPVCEKVSIIFDPFNNLTLQLPISNVFQNAITFCSLDSPPVKVNVDIDKNASFLELKEYIGLRVKVDAQRLVIAEIYKNKIFRMFDDDTPLSEENISDTDDLVIFELEDAPTNWPHVKKTGQSDKFMGHNNSDSEEKLSKSPSPLAEKILISVFHRRLDRISRYSAGQRSFFGIPSFIVVDRESAKDYDAILRKLLRQVSTMTTSDLFSNDNDTPSESEDAVLMNPEDADSSSDSKVNAQSVESEDGLVDISMDVDEHGPTQHSPATIRTADTPQPVYKSSKLPRPLRPGEVIEPMLRNLFEIKYYAGTDMVPTGFNALQDDDDKFKPILSRVKTHLPEPRRQNARQLLKRRIQNGGSSTESDEDQLPPLAPTAVDHSNSDILDSDDEDDDAVPVASMNSYDQHNSRNEKNKWVSLMDPESEDCSLIRLGEAIILDWPTQIFEDLFDNRGDEDLQGGCSTWSTPPFLPDPELDRKRKLRNVRRQNGVSLDDCLDEFGKSEILSENDAWYCPRCKEHRRASKKFELWKAPDILVVHLKRFSAHARARDKIDVFVDFPVEGLDLSSRVISQEEGKSPIYDLFAVDNHFGGLGGGHYTAYAQNFFDKSWWEYNDSTAVRKSNSKVVVTSSAYLLFYRRRSDKPLGGPFFERIVHAAHNPDVEEQDQPASRDSSVPAGEGKRLDGSSRNGLSSAFHGAGAVHQAGGGGLVEEEEEQDEEGGIPTARRIRGSNEHPPRYSSFLHDGETAMESMEVDDHMTGTRGYNLADLQTANWNFTSMRGIDEPLADDASTKAISSASSVGGRSLRSFGHGEGELKFGTPTGSLLGEEVPALIGGLDPDMEDLDAEDGGPVAEVRLGEEGEGFFATLDKTE